MQLEVFCKECLMFVEVSSNSKSKFFVLFLQYFSFSSKIYISTYISGHFLDFTNHYSDECVPLDGSILPKVKMTQNRAKFAAVNIDGKDFILIVL